MKIVLHLSKKPNAEKEKTKYYYNTEEDFVLGSRSNDAPMEYFFKKYPQEISEVVVVCSKEAYEDGSFHRLEQEIIKGRATVTKIDSDNDKKLSGELPIEVMKTLNKGEKEEILIDSTGGLRNDIISSLITSELLSYHQITIKEVIYGEFAGEGEQKNRLHSLKETTDLFLLISGMEEFSNTGSVVSLERYFALPSSKTTENIKAVLSAISSLNDSITLCRVDTIEDKLTAFNRALSQVKEEENPLFFMLIATLKEKYGENMDILDLISWCVDNGKLQQALTLFNGKMPRYYFEYFIDASDSQWQNESGKEYEDEYFNRFELDILKFDHRQEEKLKTFLAEDFQKEKFKKEFHQYVRGSKHNPFPEEFQWVGENLKKFVTTCYDKGGNKISGAICKFDSGLSYPPKKNNLPNSLTSFLENIKTQSGEFMSILLGISYTPSTKNEKHDYVKLLKNFALQLKRRQYQILCSDESQVKVLVQDYLYLKALRNQINHANETPVGSEELVHYLQRINGDRYPSWEKLKTTKEVENILRTMISDLKKIRK